MLQNTSRIVSRLAQRLYSPARQLGRWLFCSFRIAAVALLAGTAAWATLPTNAAAYCYYNTRTWKRGNQPLEEIPVYVDLGPVGDLRRTGLDEKTLVHYVMATLQEINRASGTTPRLYFGGIRRPDALMTRSSLPDGSGVHIRAARCTDDDNGQDDPGAIAIASRGSEGENKAVIRFKPLLDDDGALCSGFEPYNTVGAQQIGGGIEECVEPFPGVFSPAKGYCIPYKDFKGVLLHEMLHVMGLNHHELDSCTCAMQDGTHSNDPVPTFGSVRSFTGVSAGATRTLWRDDVEGLRALYSSYSSWPQSWKVVEYASSDGVDWDAVGEVPLASQTIVPVAASSATDDNDGYLALAYSDQGGYVRASRRNPSGAWADLGRVSPNETYTRTDGRVVFSGVTVQPPAVAYAPPSSNHPGRIAVAWVFEDETDRQAHIRWAVRNRDGGAWTISDGSSSSRTPIRTDFRRVGLGYDPVHDMFLLSYLDRPLDDNDPRAYGYVWAIEAASAELGSPGPAMVRRYVPIDSAEGLGPPKGEIMHDIGAPTCTQYGTSTTRCTIPFSTSGENGPCLGWYFGTRNGNGLGFAELERKIMCYPSLGLHDLDASPQSRNVGTLVHIMPGADPIANAPPQSFNCQASGLCANEPRTEVRLRHRIAAQVGSGGIVLPGTDLGFALESPTDMCFIPGTSASHPGPDAPGPWWPAAVGTIGANAQQYRIYVAEIEQRCGNGVVEEGEDCEPGNLGASCQSIGLGAGSLSCRSDCSFDTSECGPPGCEMGPGHPDCDCIDVIDSSTCNEDEDGCFPDGPGSFGTASVSDNLSGNLGLYCHGSAVCGLRRIQGTLRPICQACPANPGPGEAGYGCPCYSDSQCASEGQAGPTSLSFNGPTVDLSCWGSEEDGWSSGPGHCLPALDPSGSFEASGQNEREEFERTRWLCKTSCSSLSASTNVGYVCKFNHGDPEFHYAACVEDGGCDGMVTGECESTGQRCSPETSSCIAECDPGENTGSGNAGCAYWGYPPGYLCTASTTPSRCVPAPCWNYPNVPDLSTCDQFMNGGG